MLGLIHDLFFRSSTKSCCTGFLGGLFIDELHITVLNSGLFYFDDDLRCDLQLYVFVTQYFDRPVNASSRYYMIPFSQGHQETTSFHLQLLLRAIHEEIHNTDQHQKWPCQTDEIHYLFHLIHLRQII